MERSVESSRTELLAAGYSDGPMIAYLEVWGTAIPELMPLERQRTTIGRGEVSDVQLPDPSVSEVHAVIESYGAWFALRDMGSSNGTFLNNERLMGERRLRAGDELRLGGTRLTFRSQGAAAAIPTSRSEGPPTLTPRERDVLITLCRPMMGRAAFTQPATIRQLASELVVSEAAVKFHLANLYDKFDLRDMTASRRVQLANEAIRRGAVSLNDLQRPPSLRAPQRMSDGRPRTTK